MDPNYDQLLPRKESPTIFEHVVLHKECKRCRRPFETFFRAKKRCDPCQEQAVKESHARAAAKAKARRTSKFA